MSEYLEPGVCSFYHVELDPAGLVGAFLYVPFFMAKGVCCYP